jgi:hypothetical protein
LTVSRHPSDRQTIVNNLFLNSCRLHYHQSNGQCLIYGGEGIKVRLAYHNVAIR